jgi:energy-converting hydrogenase Eha subunit E
MQQFKNGDALEKKFEDSAEPILTVLSETKDEFYTGCFSTGPLGDLIHQSSRAPLTNAIKIEIFRIAFSEIFQAFIKVGTFESYITVFKKIFGNDVVIAFTIPAPGKLNIEIQAVGIELSDFIGRVIEDNALAYHEIIDYDGDNIAFQSIKGFATQYELERMLFEMVPAGIFTDIDLTFLGEA